MIKLLMALGCTFVISFWSPWPGGFISPSFTSGVFFVYPTNQLPDAISTKLISGVSFESPCLLSVVIRTGRRAEAGDILSDTQTPASVLVAKSLGAARRWWLHCGKRSTQVNKKIWLNSRLTNLLTVLIQTEKVLFSW